MRSRARLMVLKLTDTERAAIEEHALQHGVTFSVAAEALMLASLSAITHQPPARRQQKGVTVSELGLTKLAARGGCLGMNLTTLARLAIVRSLNQSN
jgi:hypothetical protein